jgi:hypothetical protein
MVEAFATVDELAARLNRTFTTEEETWVTTLLEDASTYLREDVIGLQVFPQETVTFDAWMDGDDTVVLPQQPVISVATVVQDAVELEFTHRDGVLHIEDADPESPVTVTFTFGYALAPDGLKRWTCLLVSQALVPLELNLGLSVGGLSSVALDDFKVAFADGGEATGMSLSDRNVALIRRQYGTDVHVGGSR